MIKKILHILSSSLLIVALSCPFIAHASSAEAPQIDICDAVAIARAKLGEALEHSISSAKLIELDDGRQAWRIQYATEMVVSEADSSVSYQLFKYVFVYMDGGSQFKEKKGVPRKRAILLN